MDYEEAIDIIPDIGVPLPAKYSYGDLRKRVEAACNTISILEAHGFQVGELTQEDKEHAADVVMAYAKDETSNNKKDLANLTPQAIKYAADILDEYGHKVATSAAQIRHLVTTKLIHESENPDPRIRMKALELLGKISDVGLFSDKTEVTVTHQTSDELKNKLRAKLEKLVNPLPKVTAKTQEIEVIEADKELDFSDIISQEEAIRAN